MNALNDNESTKSVFIVFIAIGWGVALPEDA